MATGQDTNLAIDPAVTPFGVDAGPAEPGAQTLAHCKLLARMT